MSTSLPKFEELVEGILDNKNENLYSKCLECLLFFIKLSSEFCSDEQNSHTNKKHPFLAVEKGFLPVEQIKLGMHVVEADGQIGVEGCSWREDVAQDHTFVVGVGMWVVHNCAKSGSSGNSGAAQLGNQFHYDMQGGGPAQLQQMYPTTQFEFTSRGPAGADVHVVGGDHPSDTSVYPGSNWSAGSDYGDFKPNSWNTSSRSRFQREISSGKLPAGTGPIWYDPIAYAISGIG